MTGNNKVWRASLAGLASVAMLATMGVSAASAAEDTAQQVTDLVTFEGSTLADATLDGYKGESLADLVGGYGVTPAGIDANSTKDGKYFGGWTVDGTTPVDWTAPVTGKVTVKPLWLTSGYTDGSNKSNLALLDFTAAASEVKLPAGTAKFYVAKDQNIPATLLPVDAPNRKLVTDYVYTTSVDTNKQTKAAADLATVTGSNVTVSQLTVTFQTPQTEEAYAVTLNGLTKAQYGYVKGAKADGTKDTTLIADVAYNTEYTVPDWFTFPQTGEANQTVTSWTDTSHNNAVVGNKLTVASDTTLVPTKGDAGVTKGYVATFLADQDGAVWKTTDATKNDKGSYFVTVPEDNPTKDGFKFAGWKAVDAAAPFGDKLIQAESDGTWPLFQSLPLTSNVTFYPVFTNRDTKLVVTFRDKNYNGSQKDVKVEVTVPGTLEKSQAPAWTRAGYTLDGWFVDRNNNGTQDTGEEYDFTEWLTDAKGDFTLTANWERATADKAKAALNYIVPKSQADFYQNALGEAATGTANDGSDFTDDTFAAYETAYKAAVEKYATDVYNNPNTTATEEASAAIINDLNAALQKLQFKHNGGAEYDAQGKLQGVHRLYNGALNRHFYSNDANEIGKLTSTQYTNSGWQDNGVMFYGTSDAYADAPAGIEAIVTEYVRFFNPGTGDHVYTVAGGEEDTNLKANAEWNREGTAFYVPSFNGTQEVSRYYNEGTNRHLFSSSASEQAGLVQNGWKLEGNGYAFKGI
ncbi:Cell wall surface anchor family protein [Bifidobacterium sp. DSM 109958]|uniref:Cell wall surface anchor family protein n=1 Tax=Bifidobacterium moraviense TaxID=2675323 RepID=A0A7Y0HZH9_9BIFI|nr:hypothetical protein [Bifidobacterium sp. DSM 109958]NMN00819.1 Cell wall surface anchor family protein [Bifidobacterium sp. DSM 109958]